MKISKSKSQPTPSTSSRLAFIKKNDYLCKKSDNEETTVSIG